MGVRRAGYFTGLVIMILGIIMVPVGIIIMAGGVYEGIQSGDGSYFGLGLGMIVFGIIMFVIGLVLSIVLKKSGSGNVNITISAHEGVIGVPDADPMLNINRQEMLKDDTQASPVLEVLPDPDLAEKPVKHDIAEPERRDMPEQKGQQKTQERPPGQEEESISLRDMVMDLQEAERGEKARLEYIAKRLDDNRTIYNSDKEFVKKQFAQLRSEITKEENTNPN